MRKKTKKESSQGSGWKNLAPRSSRKPASAAAFRKQLQTAGKLGLLSLCLATLVAGLWWFDKKFDSSVDPIEFTGLGAPVNEVIFQTDGVLSKRWFGNWFGPMRSRSLMQLDIMSIRSELEAEQQVKEVTVRREFPSTLVVEMKEKQPILVLRLRAKDNGVQDWMVAGDGSLYQGVGYPSSSLSLLPSLAIHPSLLRLNSDGEGYCKLEGIPRIAPLLNLARKDYPELYRDWRVVSYERPDQSDPGAHVLVRSGKVRSIRFAPRDYGAQMQRLKYLLRQPDFRMKSSIESVDLSHDRSVYAKI